LTSANSASVGSYLSNISHLLNMNTTTTKTLTETSSNLVSADTVAALSDYVALQTAYQAAAYCMSKVEGLTVLKYM
jgi:flagellin-like hook-associated protein FlgL